MKPGVHSGVPMAEYIADRIGDVPSLSSSCAFRLITRSPLHAWRDHPRLGGAPQEDSGVADIGSVAHDLLLGGEGKICVIDPADYPAKTGGVPIGWTNQAIRAARDQARANGLTPILAGAMAGARAMVKAAKEFVATSEIAGVFDSGESESTIVWQEGDTWLRCRPDWINRERAIHVSYKSTKASASPDAFIRGIMPSMGYDMQLAFYARGLSAVKASDTGLVWTNVMLVQEMDPPHACSLIGMSPALWEVSFMKVERAVRAWAACMRENRWPGYDSRIHYADPTPWALAAAEAEISHRD